MASNTQRFTNHEAASRYIDGMTDAEAQAFVRYGVTTVLLGRRIPESASPVVPLDLEYLCLVFEWMYANKAAIELILQGRKLPSSGAAAPATGTTAVAIGTVNLTIGIVLLAIGGVSLATGSGAHAGGNTPRVTGSALHATRFAIPLSRFSHRRQAVGHDVAGRRDSGRWNDAPCRRNGRAGHQIGRPCRRKPRHSSLMRLPCSVERWYCSKERAKCSPARPHCSQVRSI